MSENILLIFFLHFMEVNLVRTTIIFTKEKLLISECNFVDQQNFGS